MGDYLLYLCFLIKTYLYDYGIELLLLVGNQGPWEYDTSLAFPLKGSRPQESLAQVGIFVV